MSSAEKLILTMEPIYDVLTAVEKIANVTDVPLESENGNLKFADVDTGKGMAIELRDVNYFSLRDRSHILRDVNLTIGANDRICFSGPNGSGKTTLINVITGLYDSYDGTIVINDYPIGNLNEPDLRYYTGDSLMQEDIFEGSLFENITIGRKDIDRNKVKWAAKNLFLEEFVQSLPRGYDTMLESGGGRLASSIVKKIILARSVVCQPRLIVMDDFLQVFTRDERNKITDFLTDQSNNWTLLAISSDPYFLGKCDRIIYMDKGRIERIEQV